MFNFNDPIGIVTVLLIIEAATLGLSEVPRLRRFFDFVPTMFWIYFLPILANTCGVIPQTSPVYDEIGRNLLPGALVLLLIYVDVRAILRLGWYSLATMLAGSLGIIVGAAVVLLIFGRWLPPDIWKGLGALSASWIGGSANMIAVRDAIGTPQNIFLLMVVVDCTVPYIWMSVLMALARFQGPYDRWNNTNPSFIHELTRKAADTTSFAAQPITLTGLALILAVGGVGSFLSLRLADLLPEVPNTISRGAWTLIIATCLGIALSFTPVRKLEGRGASRVGYALLYFVLASIGAQADLTQLKAAPLLILVGIVWVLIHAIFTIVAGRLLRVPMALLAASSQANIGGVASAPVVAGRYHPRLVPVGLLLAVFGNIIGTYLGIVCAKLCQWVSSW